MSSSTNNNNNNNSINRLSLSLLSKLSGNNSNNNNSNNNEWMFLAAATMATAGMLYYLISSTTALSATTDLPKELIEYDELGKIIKRKKNNDDTTATTGSTSTDSKTRSASTTSTTNKSVTATTTGKKEVTVTDMDEKDIHTIIEEIDKKGKILFKNKQYLEAATVFTEAIDLILKRVSTTTALAAAAAGSTTSIAAVTTTGTNSKDASYSKQLITLLNNRSAMYEKGNIYELALVDCSMILEMDIEHSKARLRKLRTLELLHKYNDALIEVCCIQLLFMQANRINLRMGLPLPSPPVSQSKMEELLSLVLPTVMSTYITELETKRKGTSTSNNQQQQQQLPSSFTILQLLRSYTGYNAWMANAAKNGTIDKLTSSISTTTDVTTSTDNDIATKAIILYKRGCRYVYERKYDLASQDFEDAYTLVENNIAAQQLMIIKQQSTTTTTDTTTTTNETKTEDDTDSTTENIYARLLEWTGMVRHWHYELDSAIECYKKCSIIEPNNPILLVKQAGVQLDAIQHDIALELFEQALTIDSNCVDALLHRSNLRLMQNKTSLAQNDLELCIQIKPNYVMARLRLATILATTDNDTAIRQLQIAEQYDPNSSEVPSYRGEVYFAQGNMVEAVEQFEKAISLEINNPTPYVNCAMAILNIPLSQNNPIPDTNRVIELLEKAINIDPQLTAAYIHLGQIKLGTATNLQSAKDVITLYDTALTNARTPEEIKELCSMRTLAIAQVDAAAQLHMDNFSAM